MLRDSAQKGCTNVFVRDCSALHQQELRQRSGDCLPGNTHWLVENQPVCARRSALQSVSAAAQHFSNHYLKHEARPWLCLMTIIMCSSLQIHSVCVLRDFLTAEDKEGVFNADHFPLWYKRAAEQVPSTFIYSIPFSTGIQKKTVHTAFNVGTVQHNISRHNYTNLSLSAHCCILHYTTSSQYTFHFPFQHYIKYFLEIHLVALVIQRSNI